MSLLITGANGFVGSALCAETQARGFFVRASTRQHCNLPGIGPSMPIGQLDQASDWFNALEGVTHVVHLAARVHVMSDRSADPLSEFRSINVEGTLNLARQAATAGVKRFIFISSIGVNGAYSVLGVPFTEASQIDPHNSYALSKWEAEKGLLQIATETGLEIVIIRPPLVYGLGAPGNFGALVRGVHLGWPLPLGAVYNKRSFVALDNLVDFIITCINHPEAANQLFLVSDNHDLSTTELVRGIGQAAGVPPRLLPVPVSALQAVASLLGKGHVVQRLCGNLQVDISKARSLLGWVPPISLEEGLRRVLAV